MSMIIGSKPIETTDAKDFQLVNYKGKNDEFTSPSKLITLQFTALTKCTVVINEGSEIGLDAGDTFVTSKEDLDIYSFVVKEIGSKYKYIATI